MAGRVRILAGLSLAWLCGSAPAAEPARTEPGPSAELLLFVAEFRDAAGHEVDPLALAEQAEQPEHAPSAPAKTAPAASKHKQGERDEHEQPPPH